MLRKIICCILPVLFFNFSQAQKKAVASPTKIIKRFFGIHVDFHASPESDKIGETLTMEMLDTFLLRVKPDFVQVDCKGHPGISSYPTKIGTPAAKILKDPLKMWREATNKYHIPLYVHYSGVIDKQILKLHPEWASIDENGRPHEETTSVFSKYADELLIPQFKELIDNYKIDGAWVDGDCWAVKADYGAEALKQFKKETGITTLPKKKDDPGYYEFMDFNRKKFRQYVAHYVDEIHKFDPKFLITSNWAYSSMMPEAIDVNVDFLSGDVATRDYVLNAAFEARCLAPQGKQWDLMSWAINHSWKENVSIYKSTVQLEQEAAHVLSMGGGFQLYYPQNSDASIKAWKVPQMAEIANFCRERQIFTQGTTPVHQIAMLHSTEGYKRKTKELYGNGNGIFIPEMGILNAVMDGQQTVEILMEHSLTGHLQDYKVIIIPEWTYISPDFKNKLLQYVNEGGNLVVSGASTVNIFKNELGVDFVGPPVLNKHYNFGFNNDVTTIVSDMQKIKLKNSTEAIGYTFSEPDPRFQEEATGSISKYGKGKIAGIYIDLGENYAKRKAPIIREYYKAIIKNMFDKPAITVSGSNLVYVALNKQGKNFAINLINNAGQHSDESVFNYDELPATGPLTIKLQVPAKPLSVTAQPGNQKLEFNFEKGAIKFTLPSLKVHSIIMVEM